MVFINLVSLVLSAFLGAFFLFIIQTLHKKYNEPKFIYKITEYSTGPTLVFENCGRASAKNVKITLNAFTEPEKQFVDEYYHTYDLMNPASCDITLSILEKHINLAKTKNCNQPFLGISLAYSAQDFKTCVTYLCLFINNGKLDWFENKGVIGPDGTIVHKKL